MNLLEAFQLIAPELDTDPNLLLDYAAEDAVGGWGPGATYWPCGSLWDVEGRFLYALVRTMKPERALEIGSFYGCSASHILAAMERNRKGRLLSVDVNAGSGSLIPEELRHRWDFVGAAGEIFLTENSTLADLVFEDALHGAEGTRLILEAVKQYVRPRVVVSHDSEHSGDGHNVRWAWEQAYPGYHSVLIEPSDCGLAWKVLHE